MPPVVDFNHDDFFDAYDALGTSLTATSEDIKKSYRERSLVLHPDKVKECDRKKATLIFQKVKEAYDILIDERRRKLYDSLGVDFGKRKPEEEFWDVITQGMLQPLGKMTMVIVGTRLALWLISIDYIPTILSSIAVGLLIYKHAEISKKDALTAAGALVGLYVVSYLIMLAQIIVVYFWLYQMELLVSIDLTHRKTIAVLAILPSLIIWLVDDWWWYICGLMILGLLLLGLCGIISCGMVHLWLETPNSDRQAKVLESRMAIRQKLKRENETLVKDVERLKAEVEKLKKGSKK